MPTQWQDQYTDLSNVNNGNELQNGDDILAQHVNVALENSAYIKRKQDQMGLYRHILELSGTKTVSNVAITYGFYYTLYTNNNTPITLSSIYDLFDNGYNYVYLNATGFVIKNSTTYYDVSTVGITKNGSLKLFYIDANRALASLEISDGSNTLNDNIAVVF